MQNKHKKCFKIPLTKEKRCDKILSTDNNLLRGRIAMTKSVKRILTLAISGVTVFAAGGALLAPAGMSVHAEEAQQAEVPISAQSDEGIKPTSTCIPDRPEIQYVVNNYYTEATGYSQYRYYQTYNCFASYPIKNVDLHATQIWVGSNNAPFDQQKISAKPSQIIDYVVLPTSGFYCKPSLYLFSAYCEFCNTRSAANGILWNTTDSQYDARARFGYHGAQIRGTITTSYDKDGSIWEHRGSTGDRIYFSVAYNGVAAGDGVSASVKVPWIGTNETSITVNGVTFSVRTGPNKVSVKASTDVVCNSYGTLFAYYIAK